MNPTISPPQELALLRNAHTLIGHQLRARDGIIGEVKDIYFDDEHWCVRYFVVETGAWLKKRLVLIAPEIVHAPEWNAKILPVDLTQEQVRESPAIETNLPVSRQYEATLRQHYGWPVYWGAGYPGPGFVLPPAPSITVQTTVQNVATDSRVAGTGDPHLRSIKEVSHYQIEATDGEIGHAVDFLIDERSWNIRYLVVDTKHWLIGKKVVVSPWWISEVKWLESEIVIDLSKDTIKSSPDYDPDHPLTVDYAGKLHDHYGRPRYPNWQRSQGVMSIESPAFEDGGQIPVRYTRFAENCQPPLLFEGIPPETVALALLVDDPDAPKGTFTHWIAFNINPQLAGLVENSTLEGAHEGLNDAGRIGYTGPFPPSGEHRYFFRLYALDCTIDLPSGPDRETFLGAIEGHVIADAVVMGRFATPDQIDRRKWNGSMVTRR